MVVGNPIRLQKSNITGSSEMLAMAFHGDPLLVYFFPDPRERNKKSISFFQLLVSYGVFYGEPEATSSALEGVAIWLPYEKADTSPWGMVRSGALSMALRVGATAIGRMVRFGKYVNSIHKRFAPFRHCYLQLLGVDPTSQAKGYASRLVRAKLDNLDKEGIPCYLDTQAERNVKIYEHYGFNVVKEFRMPGTTFSTWAMLRMPR